jgi:hypothetical protein
MGGNHEIGLMMRITMSQKHTIEQTLWMGPNALSLGMILQFHDKERNDII